MILLFLFAIVGVAPVAGAQDTLPRPVAGNPAPVYPAAATAARSEGAVRFDAHVLPDGTVDQVAITAVPRTGVGFEAAVTEAVRNWKFTPATHEGRAVAATYSGTLNYMLMIPASRGAMFSRAPADGWSEVLTFFKNAHFKFERLDERQRFIITAPVDVTNGRFGFAADAINPDYQSARVQLYIFVPQYASPTRVYVGSVVEATTGRTAATDFKKLGVREYNAEVIGRWLLKSIGMRLGEAGEAIPATLANRQHLAERLSPGSSSLCRPTAAQDIAQPNVIFKVDPIYPADLMHDGASGRVMIVGTIFEDGHFEPSQVLPPSVAGAFATAALGATSLWVYEPTRRSGCPVPTIITVSTTFTLKH